MSDFNEAVRAILKRHALPTAPDAWSDKGDYDKAIADFDKAITIDPANWNCHAKSHRRTRLAGEYDKAISDIDTAATFAPNDPYVYRTRSLGQPAFRPDDKGR